MRSRTNKAASDKATDEKTVSEKTAAVGDGAALPEDAPPAPAAQASAAAEGQGGLKWLKYTGIGPRKQRTGGQAEEKADEANAPGGKRKPLSGEAITSLGSLEAEILSVLWEIGAPATGMAVMEQSLYKRRRGGQEPVAFATVATTLRRLAEKGVVISQKNEAGTPVYTPTVEREEMAARILNNVSETLLGHPLRGLLPKLLGNLPAADQPAAATGRGRAGRVAVTGPGESEQESVRRLLAALERVAAEKPEGGEDGPL